MRKGKRSVLRRIGQLTLRQRAVVQLMTDQLAWAIAIVLGLLIRFDFEVPWDSLSAALAASLFVAWASQLGIGSSTHLYRGRYRFGSYEEVAGVATTVLTAAALTLCLDLLISANAHVQRVPVSSLFAAAIIALAIMAATRYLWRGYLERTKRANVTGDPLIVFGAGEGGFQVVRSMLHDALTKYVPVALLDDDPRKQRLRILGVRVQGDRSRIAAVAEETGARHLLIAIPSADARLLRSVTESAEQAGLQVKVLPPVSELFDGVGVSDIRDIDLVDLLGRRQLDTDIDAIAGYLSGRKVLVTGAGGSIGSELCRQIHRYEPSELMMLDRDESALHAVQLSLHGRALLDSPELILADIRDGTQIRAIFESRQPDVVFHAAALKHLTLLERFPSEAVKTNVQGTMAVLEAASAVNVQCFVNISTDKAADPTSVLGFSKRITERLTAGFAKRASNDRYISVRFGNVLGSRGSVLGTFTNQVVAGGPITVTHPEVTRYFMTVSEAVQLVIQAGAMDRSGETLVLDMGEPVKIDDVARRLAGGASRPIDIVYTGLRPGEKLHEDLFGAGEVGEPSEHPLISHVKVPLLEPVHLADVMGHEAEPLRLGLQSLAGVGDMELEGSLARPS